MPKRSPTGHGISQDLEFENVDLTVPSDPRQGSPFPSESSIKGTEGHGCRVRLSPGASKPATYGRFKTSHDSGLFRTRLLNLTGSATCSKSQVSIGILFPSLAAFLRSTIRPLSRLFGPPWTAYSPSFGALSEPVGALAGFELDCPSSEPGGALAGFESSSRDDDVLARSFRR